jgi:2-oxoglutarate/2-oxoacid ferredoxin oxidoreductase subunit alpha
VTRFSTGNRAAIDAALAAGCRMFAGYPVTPATEALEAAAQLFPQHGRVFIPTEGEVSAINLMGGASLGGYRAMTATSGLGLSLMSEGLSFYSGMTELPGVVLVQQRWGPGDGSLGPGQDCYNQATRAVGHGDFSLIVLAPASVQELADHVILAFDLADRYGLFVIVLGDQIVAMSSEQYEVPEPAEPRRRSTAFGAGGERVVLPELVAVDEKAGDFQALEAVARRWETKFRMIEQSEQRAQYLGPDGPLDVLVVAFGSLARIAEAARTQAGSAAGRVGILRPITLWPFPVDAVRAAAARAAHVVVAELNMGQMLVDVRGALDGRELGFVNWLGGHAPTPAEFTEGVRSAVSGAAPAGAR